MNLAVLTGLLLASCGDDGGARSGPASGAGPSRSSAPAPPSPEAPSGADVAFTQVALVSQTAAGGRVSRTPVRLDDRAAVAAFGDRFRGNALGRRVRAAVRRAGPPADRVLLASVVAVGCDVPPGVRVRDSATGVEITPLPVASPVRECLAPVTTVAVVSVAADAV